MNLPSFVRRLLPGTGSTTGEVSLTFATNVILAGLSLISGPLLARWLLTEGRGQLGAIQALPMIVGSMGMLGLQDSIIYFGSRDRAQVGRYALSATALLLLLGLPIVAVSAWLMPWYLSGYPAEIVFASRIYLGLFFVNALMGISIFTTRAAHDIALWNKLRILPSALWVVVILVMIVVDGMRPTTLAYVYLGTLFLLAAAAVIPVRHYLRGHWVVRPALWPGLLRYGLPLAAGSSPQILNERIDQLIVIGALSETDAGLYIVATTWSMLMRLPGEALASVGFSKIAGLPSAEAQRRFIVKACWAMMGLSLIFGAALALAAPIGIPWVFGADFAAAGAVAVILVLSTSIRNVARMLQISMQSVGKPSAVLVSEWIGLALLGAGLVFLLPRLGLAGAAWASTLSSAGCALAALIAVRGFLSRDGSRIRPGG